jgi:hypothetical protein
LKEKDARTFWIQFLLAGESECDLATFSKGYLQYLSKAHAWGDDCPMSLDQLCDLVKPLVDVGSGSNIINMTEFNNFCVRFKPLSQSFIKVLSIIQTLNPEFEFR